MTVHRNKLLFNETNRHTHFQIYSRTKLYMFRVFLVNNQRVAQNLFYVFIFIYNSLRVSGASCSSSGETNCINTTSGNCHAVLVAVSCAGATNT
jgi:hypothetical protein